MQTFPRPASPEVEVSRESVDGSCSECGASALMRYPVLSEGGWFKVIKCQECLHSTAREAWNLMGPIELLSETV